jgi:hypothetical protein
LHINLTSFRCWFKMSQLVKIWKQKLPLSVSLFSISKLQCYVLRRNKCSSMHLAVMVLNHLIHLRCNDCCKVAIGDGRHILFYSRLSTVHRIVLITMWRSTNCIAFIQNWPTTPMWRNDHFSRLGVAQLLSSSVTSFEIRFSLRKCQQRKVRKSKEDDESMNDYISSPVVVYKLQSCILFA